MVLVSYLDYLSIYHLSLSEERDRYIDIYLQFVHCLRPIYLDIFLGLEFSVCQFSIILKPSSLRYLNSLIPLRA